MENVIFIDVDTQYSFMHRDGRFYVPNAEDIITNLEKLSKFAHVKNIPVIATIDVHKGHDIEIELSNSSQNSIEIIKGFEKIKETNSLNSIIIEKTQHNPFSNSKLSELLKGKTTAYVYGVATEFCIQATVLELLKRGIETFVVEDAIKSVSEKSGKVSMYLMRAKGAKFIITESLLKS